MQAILNGNDITPPIKATRIPYDNTSSSLSGENLQEVVDELNTKKCIVVELSHDAYEALDEDKKKLNNIIYVVGKKTDKPEDSEILPGKWVSFDNTDTENFDATEVQSAIESLLSLQRTDETTMADHISSTANPHGVTKEQVGLGSCDNTADADKSVKYATSAGSVKTVQGFSSIKNSTPVQAGESANKRSFYLGMNGGTAPVYCVPAADMSVGSATSATNATNVKDSSYSWTATKINTQFGTKLSLSGGTMSGALNMSSLPLSAVYGIFSDGHPIALASDNGVSVLNRALSSPGTLSAGTLQYNTLSQVSYRGAKENIQSANISDYKKILDIPIHKFDYRPGFGGNKKGVVGVIVDEVEKIIPEATVIPEDWDESSFNELKGTNGNSDIPSIDPTVLVFYLIGLVQEQQKEIESMKNTLATLQEKGDESV